MANKTINKFILNHVDYIGTSLKPKRETLEPVTTVEAKDARKAIEYLLNKVSYIKQKILTQNEINKLTLEASRTLEKNGRFEFETLKNKYCITVKKTVVNQFQII
jgi:hypothetical protein